MNAISDHSKINDDTWKEIENRFLFFKRKLRDTLKEIQKFGTSGYKNG